MVFVNKLTIEKTLRTLGKVSLSTYTEIFITTMLQQQLLCLIYTMHHNIQPVYYRCMLTHDYTVCCSGA